MALGKRKTEDQMTWIASCDLPRSPGHPFYDKLNQLLAEADFDPFVESLCGPYYDETLGAPSIPPGVYFRMLFIGYFEGISSQRGIAWRCADSLSLRSFLGIPLTKSTPHHSSLTTTRQRLPEEVHDAVFLKVLRMAHERELLVGKTAAVDATLLEANAAMKSIVRRDTGEDYRAFLKRLAEEAGLKEPTDEELKRFDKERPGKKMSNREWESKTDPDSRIMKMKDHRTHLSYKAEHVVDLDTEMLLSVEVYHGDKGDTETLVESLDAASENLKAVDEELEIKEVPADSGYHSLETLVECQERGIRTYIAESKDPKGRVWTGKSEEERKAFEANRRRCRGKRSKRLQRLRREKAERSFAHMCETGGARRSWLRGVGKLFKRYVIHGAAHNLGVMMRVLFGIGTPRSLQGEGVFALLRRLIERIWRVVGHLLYDPEDGMGISAESAPDLRDGASPLILLKVA
jgi:transposase